jgi:hypothetical protein
MPRSQTLAAAANLPTFSRDRYKRLSAGRGMADDPENKQICRRKYFSMLESAFFSWYVEATF